MLSQNNQTDGFQSENHSEVSFVCRIPGTELFLMLQCFCQNETYLKSSSFTFYPCSNTHTLSCVSEIEAKEACDWLRAAGFPQYAQLFEGKKKH